MGHWAMKKGEYVYEVKWEGTNENTWEPVVNVAHHVKEMTDIDKTKDANGLKRSLNVAQEHI